MAEDIVKLISRPGSLIILVFFFLRTPVPISKGNPLSGGAKHAGGKFFWRFSTEIAVYLRNGTV